MKKSSLFKESKLRKLKNQASKYVEKGKYQKALPIYKRILESFPNDVPIMLKVGDICRKLQMKKEAVAVYSNAAEHQAKVGSLLQAIAICKVILEIDSHHHDTQKMLAALYTKQYGDQKKPDLPIKQAAAETEEPDKETGTSRQEPVQITTAFEVESGQPSGDIAPPEELVIDFTDKIEAVDTEDEEYDERTGEVDDYLEEIAQDIEEIDHGLKEHDHVLEEIDSHAPDNKKITLTRPPAPSTKLPEVPLLSGLSEDAFIELIGAMPVHRFKAGETIIHEKAPSDSAYIIVEGIVDVVKNEVIVASLEEGALFGEMALLVPGARQASVRAATSCELLEFSAVEMQKLKEQYPDVAQSMLHFAEERLLKNLLLTSPLFVMFDTDERTRLMELFEPLAAQEGDNIITESTQPDGMYLLVSGKATVTVEEGGEPVLISEMHSNDIFGEMSLLTRQPARATVRAAMHCRMLMLPAGRFNELIMTHPQVLEMLSSMNEQRQNELEQMIQNRKIASSTDGGSAPL